MERVNRRQVLKTALAGGAGWSMLSLLGETQGKNRPPNILFILSDDLGYGDLGCYGQERIQTPCLDRMASEGIRFTQAYSGSTVCAPSRCAWMTGFHTGHARIRGNALVPLLPEDVTVAEVLKKAGYKTGMVGKWGLGEPETSGIPNLQGFDEWFGYLNQKHAHNYYPDTLWRNQERVMLEGNANGQKTLYSHDLFTQEGTSFIERHKDEPFFLALTYTLPHANNELGAMTGNGMEVPTDEPYSGQDWPQPQKNHAAMITRMDRDIGRILDLLKRLGLEENTVVFFSSDNGPHKEGGADPAFFKSAGSLRGYKRALYEGGIRVPMVVRWSGTIAPGQVSDHVWAFWDFLPTAADLAGTEVPKGIDGLSVVKVLMGGKAVEHEYLHWEFHEAGFSQAIRMDTWKGVRRGTRSQPIEVYDLTKDVGETSDVSGENPDVVAKIKGLMETSRADSPDFPIKEGR